MIKIPSGNVTLYINPSDVQAAIFTKRKLDDRVTVQFKLRNEAIYIEVIISQSAAEGLQAILDQKYTDVFLFPDEETT